MDNGLENVSVLVVDDHAPSRALVARALNDLGVGQVRTVANAAQALDHLQHSRLGIFSSAIPPVDLLITEWDMEPFGGALLLLAFSQDFGFALTALLIVAGMATASDILTQSMIQSSVPNKLRGRAMGAWVLAIGLAPVGHLEMGFLSVSVGIANALMINRTLLIVLGVIATLAVPSLRKS